MEEDFKKPRKGTAENPKRGDGSLDDDAYHHPSGLRRTLSTELAARQADLRILKAVDGLVETRIWAPGDVMIRKGDTDRDIFFVTRGVVEIWSEEQDGGGILAELDAPYIVGDMAFLSGVPRTATAKAKTEVKAFVLKHENFMEIFKRNPDWLTPFLSSLVSGIKSLHYKISDPDNRV